MQARKSRIARRESEIASLYGECRNLLERLDQSGQHQAAAHVSMALEVMRRARPGPAPRD